MAAIIAGTFLIIHILMIMMFRESNVQPMVIFNIFSIFFYLVMLYVSFRGPLPFYAPAVYLEVVAHMTLAVIFTGWESGFQVTLIGMNVLAFYAEYVGRTLKLKYVPMLPCCLLGMACYLGSDLYVHVHPAPYRLPEKTSFALTLIWGVIVFSIIISVLYIFVLIVRGSEEKLEYQMSHDKLTGLPNRYYLSEYVDKIEKREGLNGFWLAIGDLDDFKKINDTYGHNAGDYALSETARLTKNDEGVLCCRWGGADKKLYEGKQSGKNKVVY